MLSVAILAEGLATRLHPITKTIPKKLIEVSGQPFIFHQLSYLRTQGVKKVVLCIGHLGEMMESFSCLSQQHGTLFLKEIGNADLKTHNQNIFKSIQTFSIELTSQALRAISHHYLIVSTLIRAPGQH